MIQNGMILDGIYQIIREIGQGGTGIIYLAEHLRLHKKVVVKKIKNGHCQAMNVRAEVDILKRLHHTYLPQVYDFLMVGGEIYTVMEYIEGRDLQYYLECKECFSEETLKKWLTELAQVLEYLHSQRPPILHSDIKPANIMVTESGDVCLIDFNISLNGETSKDVQGISPWYAAPEQYERAQHILYGKKDHIVVDGRMDIYSLGATFYRMMSGYLPVPTQDQSRMLRDMEIPYSDGFKEIISRMIRPVPSERYASARKLLKALEDISKADPLYRRYGRIQIGSVLCWLLCVIAGLLCIYYGSWKNTVEHWQQDYEKLYLLVKDENEAEVMAMGTGILNNITYQRYLEENGEKKAKILNILGDSCFSQEQYEDALSYYREAWNLDPSGELYFENYLLTLIRTGSGDRAAVLMESYEGRRVLSREKRDLLTLEIAWAAGETEGALEDLEELVQVDGGLEDARLIADACVLLADSYLAQEAYADAVSVLERAVAVCGEKNLQRELGEVCFLAAQKSDREIYRAGYLSKAQECYLLLNQDTPAYEDRLNLALVQRAMGKYESSNTVLREARLHYPDKYELSMWICYNDLDLLKARNGDSEVREDLSFHYQNGKYLYDSQKTRNENMENLNTIMNRLGE